MKKRRRGRPRVDLVYKCRTQAWLDAVSIASGWMTPAQLELLFCNAGDAGSASPKNRPGLWEKYSRGKVGPTIYSRNGKQSIVERVEQRFPGTAQWITLPLWDLLTAKHMSMNDLKEIYSSFAPEVRDLIVVEPPDEYPEFWHTQEYIDDLGDKLLEIGDVDAVSAILCLFREAKLKQAIDEFECAKYFWKQCEPILKEHAILKRFSNFFYMTIDVMIEGDEDYW